MTADNVELRTGLMITAIVLGVSETTAESITVQCPISKLKELPQPQAVGPGGCIANYQNVAFMMPCAERAYGISHSSPPTKMLFRSFRLESRNGFCGRGFLMNDVLLPLSRHRIWPSSARPAYGVKMLRSGAIERRRSLPLYRT